MIDIKKILLDVCEDERVLDENIDLIDSGLLDSYAFLELFSTLEDNEIFLNPTQIDRNKLRSIKGIEELVNEYLQEKSPK